MDGSLKGKGMDVCLLWIGKELFFFFLCKEQNRNSFSNVGVQFCYSTLLVKSIIMILILYIIMFSDKYIYTY